VHQLKREDLIQILTEPKNALTKQYQRFFNYGPTSTSSSTDDALVVDRRPRALEAARTGARGLRSIIEERAPRRDVRAALAPRTSPSA